MNKLSARIRPTIAFARQFTTEPISSDFHNKFKSMIRVDLAGETGADNIYAGQMAILGMLVPCK